MEANEFEELQKIASALERIADFFEVVLDAWDEEPEGSDAGWGEDEP